MPDPKLHVGSMSQENKSFMAYAGLKILERNIKQTAKIWFSSVFVEKISLYVNFCAFFNQK